MKKLYVNIEDVYIKGNPLQLTEVVSSMDFSLQSICQATEDVTSIVVKYSSSNKGQQYKKMVNTLIKLRDELYNASIQINSMQNEIVAYQNKVLRYEDMSQTAMIPNKHMVNRSVMNIDTSDVQFRVPEMKEISAALNNYSESVFHNMQNIVRGKNDIGQIWLDSQYRDFAEFIDELNMESLNSLKVFGEYVAYLKEKIKELS